MSLRLRAGRRQFIAVMAHAPYDSLADLTTALASVVEGAPQATVKWNAEPEQFDFEFTRDGEEMEFKVTRFRGHRRLQEGRRVVFSYQGSTLEICEAFRHELSQLSVRGETDEFEQNWKRAFPLRELQHLTKAVEAFRSFRKRHHPDPSR
jgi:cold shock CspA family protein